MDGPPYMASWAFPMVSVPGRIYVIWNQNKGVRGNIDMHTGGMSGFYSDDQAGLVQPAGNRHAGQPLRRSGRESATGMDCLADTTTRPERRISGRLLALVQPQNNVPFRREIAMTWLESVVRSSVRFTNVDNHPEPKNLQVRYSAFGDKALRVPHWIDPLRTVAQEPSSCDYQDNRLFCVMRTNTGYIWYSLCPVTTARLGPFPGRCSTRISACRSCNRWAAARSTSWPMAAMSLLYHKQPGKRLEPEVTDKGIKRENTWGPRRPAFLALAEFRPGAQQPLWFGEPRQFLDSEYDVTGERNPAVVGVGTYTSFTTRNGENVLWHPDRKVFLLGKKVTDEFLAGMKASPEK